MILGLLLDLEGVLYESGHTIVGAADAVRQLAELFRNLGDGVPDFSADLDL